MRHETEDFPEIRGIIRGVFYAAVFYSAMAVFIWWRVS